MSKPTRIAELSARIAANTAEIDNFLAPQSLPPPSFDPDAPPTIMRFGLSRLVPPNGSITSAELAVAASLGESHVWKLIRHAITQHIFREPRPGIVSHSAIVRLLAKDADVTAWVRWRPDDCWLAASHTQSSLGMFDVLAAEPEREARFAAGMRLYAARPDLDVHHLAEAEVAITLARAFPLMNLVVQDIDKPTILEVDSRKPDDVADRPIREADVCLFRACLHNWSDKLEDMLPGVASDVRSGGLNMMMLFNAGDRKVSGWAHLFELTSPGFQFHGRKQSPGSGLWVLESSWNGA
ncbi:S-adenosyl-L-methionine-dependent methyltransferase [Xylaria sp. FL0043]|nr:S-adenosyl-L-methionine-dependent methyltransferase [Xylaria sp. FL0043]